MTGTTAAPSRTTIGNGSTSAERSAPVSTARTPGSASAASVSILTSLPWA